MLIQNGAEVPQTIHFAAALGDLNELQKFLNKKKNADVKDKKGKTPIFWTAANGHSEVTQRLIDYGAKVNSKAKMGKNLPKEYFVTPLHKAAKNGHLDVLTLLIESGADANAIIDSGDIPHETPLDLAIKNKKTAAAELLKKHGAKKAKKLKKTK
jgi:ankyrin repeat protein